MQQAYDSPEDFSPVVPFEQVGDNLVGRKIEIRWWTEVDGEVNGEAEKQPYLHCYEGKILEIIPYTPQRKNYAEFRYCKDPVALVKWDDEFNMPDSHVPLNDKKYAKEDQHCGWNIIRDDFARFITETANIRRLLEATDKGKGAGGSGGSALDSESEQQSSKSRK